MGITVQLPSGLTLQTTGRTTVQLPDGLTFQEPAVVVVVSSRSAASRLGLYSSVDVWSTPLVSWAKEQNFKPELKKIKVPIIDEELILLEAETKELRNIIKRAEQELAGLIEQTELKKFIKKAKATQKQLKKEKEERFLKLLRQEDEELLLLLL